MKSFRLALLTGLLSIPTLAFAQDAPAHKAVGDVALSDSQKAFDHLKMLAGSWVGQLTTDPQTPQADAL